MQTNSIAVVCDLNDITYSLVTMEMHISMKTKNLQVHPLNVVKTDTVDRNKQKQIYRMD